MIGKTSLERLKRCEVSLLVRHKHKTVWRYDLVKPPQKVQVIIHSSACVNSHTLYAFVIRVQIPNQFHFVNCNSIILFPSSCTDEASSFF